MCDTIEGLILAYYELLYKRLVISIVLHLTTLSSTSVMECLHGKTASYNLLEGIFANAVAHEVQRLCVWNPVMVVKSVILVKGQHDCLVMNENERWQKCMEYKRSNERMVSVWFGMNSLRQ